MKQNQRFSIAPMLDWTDRHYRYFMRIISRHTFLYTEMITAQAILHGDKDYLLGYDASEHPLALQIGGSDPAQLKECAKIAVDFNYDEINLNVGCPSDRVQSGQFGACLMAKPELVAQCVEAMQSVVQIPVTVKTRIGIDHQDSYEDLVRFIQIVSGGGCQIFIIHARKAWLKGLSPKQNRDIPPLNYAFVKQLKQDFPHLTFILNGGVATLEAAKNHLTELDGVMMGRAAYYQPYLFSTVDRDIFGDAQKEVLSREQVLEVYIDYIKSALKKGTRLHQLTRHILGLYHGEPGARTWRRILTEKSHHFGADEKVVQEALETSQKIL